MDTSCAALWSAATQAFVLVDEWLGPSTQPDQAREHSLAELARRYVAGHGPATPEDLARWSGLPVGDARIGFSAIAEDLAPVNGMFDFAERADLGDSGLPEPRLLGPFEPVLLGWTSRTGVMGGLERRLITTNGVFRAFALVDGVAAANWRIRRTTIDLEPLRPIPSAAAAALDRDAQDVLRFLGRI